MNIDNEQSENSNSGGSEFFLHSNTIILGGVCEQNSDVKAVSRAVL